jgi:hypothetical protein
VKHTCVGCPPPKKVVTQYTHVVLGRDIPGGTMTTEWDMYGCDDHTREYTVGEVILASDTGSAASAEEWTVLESSTTALSDLRGLRPIV